MFVAALRARVPRLLRPAALLLLTACATPYSPPKLEPVDSEFPGALQLLDQHRALHVVWIHGMCPHTKEDWADVRRDELAARLKIDKGPDAKPVADFIYRYELTYQGMPITLDMIVWSQLIDERRASLCFDSRPANEGVVHDACKNTKADYPYARAKLNDALKSGLMNSCLADAMIYIGAQGEEIRARIRPEIEKALGIDVAKSATGEAPAVMLVSESLGSKVMFDVLQEIVKGASRTAAATRAKQTLDRTRQLVMFANQVPILDLTGPKPTPEQKRRGVEQGEGSSLRTFLEALPPPPTPKGVQPRARDTRRRIVAFTDPNDLLSYRFPKGYFLESENIEAVNVLVSNDRAWFGFLENPTTAHRTYGKNDDVMALFLCGKPAMDTGCPVKARR
ncbi:MAG TPA: hypothetical protein VFA81_11060 [Burkholderiales bacterium]|nr:hypothetical protein [Burkholderiales bacterium]